MTHAKRGRIRLECKTDRGTITFKADDFTYFHPTADGPGRLVVTMASLDLDRIDIRTATTEEQT